MSQPSLLSLVETRVRRVLEEKTATIRRLCLVARPRFGEPGMDISHVGAIIVRRPDSTFTVWSVYIRVDKDGPRVAFEHGYYGLEASEAEDAFNEKMGLHVSDATYRCKLTAA